jgi:beta-glucosidase
LKHFFLNDQETNRIGVCTFSNEQALREIYLRGFQYAFETTGEDDPACNGVMGAFNRLGLRWSGHHTELWNEVMRGEWGFTGVITTDFGQKQQSLMEPHLAYEAGTTYSVRPAPASRRSSLKPQRLTRSFLQT